MNVGGRSGSAHFEPVGSAGGSELDPAHYEDFQRLVKTLRYASPTQLLVAEVDDVGYREELIERLDLVARDVGLVPDRFVIGAQIADVRALEDALARIAESADLIHLTGDQTWFDELADPRWEGLNLRREALFERVPAKLLIWLTPARVARLAQAAPDLWAWRGGVYCFTRTRDGRLDLPPPRPHETFAGPDALTSNAASARVADLRHTLAERVPEEFRLEMLDELASLEQQLGRLAEALRIRAEEELPVYERLGDLRSAALTRGKIADVLEARGELGEALRIRLEEQLPVYERLGDVRSAAMTRGQIADVYQARGELDEALRIRLEAELPVYERLGDVRSAALTRGKIADVYQARGELDEALRIRLEEELPVYERLGDVRSAAITETKIALIYAAKGDRERAAALLRSAHQKAARMRLAETSIIAELLEQLES